MHDSLESADRELRQALAGAYRNGWRMVDLLHWFRKFPVPRQVDLLRNAEGGLAAWQSSRGLTEDEAIFSGKSVAMFLRRLGRLPAVDAPAPGVEDKLLSRVRGLLAKAESTEYQAEAEALTEKAHELMARYSIDDSRVHTGIGTTDVVCRRMFIDDPYARQRMLLLVEVAEACGCRVLLWVRFGLATVFGMSADVEATEVLFTSLLLQASQAMLSSHETPRDVPPARVAAFRRAFLVGFAHRIGDRLRELRRRVVEDMSAESGHDLLPALADRDAVIESALAPYEAKAARRLHVSDVSGLLAGERAGATASLTRDRLAGRQELSA